MKMLATVVAILVFASFAAAQTQAAMAIPAKVEQGKNIVFDIAVKPTPNLQGVILLFARPAGGGAETNGAQGIGPGQTSIQLALTVPIDATKGKWIVTRAVFRLSSPGGSDKDLQLADQPSFEVVEHKAVVEPEYAVVVVR